MIKFFKKISRMAIVGFFLVVITGVIYYYEEVKDDELVINTSQVCVANELIEANTVITDDMVVTEMRFADDVVKEMETIYISADDVVGKRTIVPIYPMETIKKDRIVENEDYMGQEGTTQLSFELYADDQSLDIQRGDIIDFWIEPVAVKDLEEDEVEKFSSLIFKEVEIVEVCNSNHVNIETLPEKAEAGADVPAFVTVELLDKDVELFLNINEKHYTKRITLYSEEKEYDIVVEKHLAGDTEEVSIEDVIEETEVVESEVEAGGTDVQE